MARRKLLAPRARRPVPPFDHFIPDEAWSDTASFPARPYQVHGIERIWGCFAEHDSTLLINPTGTGKTVSFAHVCRLWPRELGRILILAHRDELIEQAYRKIRKICPHDVVEIEAARSHASRGGFFGQKPHSRIVIASKDTLCNASRLHGFDPSEFGLIIVDEAHHCHVAGTKVDGRAIETIKAGDQVLTYNHASGTSEMATVRSAMRSVPRSMATVRLQSGKSMVCTADHPFYLPKLGCYLPVSLLSSNDMVLTTTYDGDENGKAETAREAVRGLRENVLVEGRCEEGMLKALQFDSEFSGSQTPASDFVVPWMRQESRGDWVSSSQRACLLLRCLPSEGSFRNIVSGNVTNQQKVRIRTHEDQQPYAPSRCSGEGVYLDASHGLEAGCAGRERPWSHGAGEPTVLRSGLESSGCSNEGGARNGLPNPLQDRHWQLSTQSRHRDRWAQSQCVSSEGAGCEEAGVLGVDWVDSVEIHEPTSDGTFGGVCPDGFVYNLEVEPNNNYFAEGVLVHNCIPKNATYWAIVSYFSSARLLGVTATPDRRDEQALGQAFTSVAMVYDMLDAITDGWLVPIMQQYLTIEDYDLSHIKVGKNGTDLNEHELDLVMRQERVLHGIVSPTIELSNKSNQWGSKRPTLVFASSVAHAKLMTEIFNRHHERSGTGRAAVLANDIMDLDTRRNIIQRFKRGDIQYLINCGIATEGFDVPGIRIVVIARPTTSRALYQQMVGRGSRPHDDIVDALNAAQSAAERRTLIYRSCKPSCLIIDPVGNSGSHKLVTAPDILGGFYDDEDVENAKARLRGSQDGRGDPVAELLKARADREAIEAERRKEVIIKASYSTRTVDPFNVFDMHVGREPGWFKGRMASDKQKEFLLNNGFAREQTDELSMHRASKLIEEVVKRRNEGLATFGQAKVLQKYGYPPNITFNEARAILDDLAKRGWPSPETVG